VLFAARSATPLHRLLDVLPVFVGDDRVERDFTLVPGSDYGLDALVALERAGGHSVPWEQARARAYDLILAASPKGELSLLRGTCVLLPHGAGFSKSVHGEGSPLTASGLDPVFLAPDGDALADIHALAHPSQVARLAAVSPQAAERATVVGDPTLDRVLTSAGLRERYRAALGTGGRTLIAVTSTWGPESLLRRRPELVAELTAELPHDAFQVALIVHPNERSRLGSFNLAEHLSPALDAGLVLPEPYEEWAAVLVAADAVISDHGSTALYAAALGRPVVAACDGGDELIPGTPMAGLLARAPRFSGASSLATQLDGHRPEDARAIAAAAFAEQGRSLGLLRAHLYDLLGLDPPPIRAEARPLPQPSPPPRTPSAFAVRVLREGNEIQVERRPAHSGAAAHHLAAEHGAAGERHAQSAGLLYRRASPAPADAFPPSPHDVAWTAAGWTAYILGAYPGCATAGVVLSPERCLLRGRSGALLSVRVDARLDGGRVERTDPAAALSAVHAWLADGPAPPARLDCVIGGRAFAVHVRAATAVEAAAVC
jgi:hypothetical protein